MGFYEICAIILVSGIIAHIVVAFEMQKASKILDIAMEKHNEEIKQLLKASLDKR